MSLRGIALYSLCVALLIPGCRKGTTGKSVPAPDFVLNDLNSRAVRLSDFRGKIVIVNFWASWCPPCRAEIPHFVDLHQEYRERGFEIVGITLSSPTEDVKGMVQKFGILYPIVIGDEQMVKRYADLKHLSTTEPGKDGILTDPGGIEFIPTTFVIDRGGKVYRKYVGPRDRTTFERDITALL